MGTQCIFQREALGKASLMKNGWFLKHKWKMARWGSGWGLGGNLTLGIHKKLKVASTANTQWDKINLFSSLPINLLKTWFVSTTSTTSLFICWFPVKWLLCSPYYPKIVFLRPQMIWFVSVPVTASGRWYWKTACGELEASGGYSIKIDFSTKKWKI